MHSYKFYEGLKLEAAMPDELFKKDIALLLPYLDFYVSSLSCGFRRPNSKVWRGYS